MLQTAREGCYYLALQVQRAELCSLLMSGQPISLSLVLSWGKSAPLPLPFTIPPELHQTSLCMCSDRNKWEIERLMEKGYDIKSWISCMGLAFCNFAKWMQILCSEVLSNQRERKCYPMFQVVKRLRGWWFQKRKRPNENGEGTEIFS